MKIYILQEKHDGKWLSVLFDVNGNNLLSNKIAADNWGKYETRIISRRRFAMARSYEKPANIRQEFRNMLARYHAYAFCPPSSFREWYDSDAATCAKKRIADFKKSGKLCEALV